MHYVEPVHHPAFLLITFASASTLAANMLNLVLLSRDQPLHQSGLTWQQRVAARYHRHPRLITAVLACFAVSALLWIAYVVTFLV
jgi:hypothetical protein